MNALFTILIVLIVISSILLVLVVLLQNGKGDGLASNFVSGNQVLGVRQTANILEKFTWGLVAAILLFSVIASFNTGVTGASVDITKQVESATTTEQPSFPTAPVEQAAPATENPATETSAQ